MSRERKTFDHNTALMSHRAILGPPVALNTTTPCAACKLLRRRCAQECPFSPYFSPHEPQKFASVHKIFGASNVSKMLLEVPESQRADAANCLVYEANARLQDPVYGCMGAISSLQHQAQSLQAELNAVRAEIMRYKYRDQNPPPPSMQPDARVYNNNMIVIPPTSDSEDSSKVASPTSTVTSAHPKRPYWSVLNHNSR